MSQRHIFDSRIKITRLKYREKPMKYQIMISTLQSEGRISVMIIVHMLDNFDKNVVIRYIQKSGPHLFYPIMVRKYH